MLYPVLQNPLRPVVGSLFDRPVGVNIRQMLFGAGEQGGWYDVSDMSTLFQDAAGTTPVTAVEQPVGLILDKSGQGNHATQATTTKRPVLSRRVNLVLNSEAEGGTGGTPGTAPSLWELHIMNGTYAHAMENGKHRFSAVAGRSTIRAPITWAANTQYRATVRLTNNLPVATSVFQVVHMGLQAGTGVALTYYVDGAITSSVPPGTHTVEAVGSYTGGTALNFLYFGAGAGSVHTADVTLLSADVRLNIDSHLPYQRVNTATDYDADPSKFPTYLRYDGIDDGATSPTGGGGTAGFFYSSAITVAGGAGTARTLFSDAGANTGYIVRINASNQLELAAGNGTAYTTVASAAALTAPTSAVVQAWDDGANLNVRIGSGPVASVARPAVSAGTAGFTVGQDNGASSGHANVREYSTVYRKDSAPTLAQRDAVAAYQRLQARFA